MSIKVNNDVSSVEVSRVSKTVIAAYSESIESVLGVLKSSQHGLSHDDANSRIEQYGRNTLPKAKLPGMAIIFLHQFKSPLIYVLLAAAVLSITIKEWSDAGFIFAVLVINAVIGTIQEFSAQRLGTRARQAFTS